MPAQTFPHGAGWADDEGRSQGRGPQAQAGLGRRRGARDYKDADQMREKITAQGLEVRDTAAGTVVLPAPEWARGQETISASGDVESLLEGPPDRGFTVGLVARQGW